MTSGKSNPTPPPQASGTPKLAVDAGGAWLAWTDVGEDGVAQLKGARISR